MNIYYPAYYDRFSCIAAACPDSCCKEWEVDVDDAAAAYYRALPGELGDRLRAVLRDTEDGTCMTIENGRCPMWRQDGLCQIQAQLGHDALCHTCRVFPRLRHDFGSFAELGLELSCPEAARLILRPDYRDILCKHSPDSTPADYDTDVMDVLLSSRKTVLNLLDDTSLSVPQTLAVLLLYAHEVQSQIDGGAPAVLDADAALSTALKYANSPNVTQLLDFFKDLEILSPQWAERLENPSPAPWDDRFRYLARYFVMRYWLQAVSDLDLISRVKLTLVSCILIRILGGDLIKTAQRFSKEIENDPDNIDALLDGAYTSPALTDIHLLSLLLHEEK